MFGEFEMERKIMSCDSNFHFTEGRHFPIGTKGVSIDRVISGSFSLMKEEVSFPCAVIRQSAIESNLTWMQTFANHHDVKLCPHGKTTMSPDLFKQQLDQGAWGLTVASSAQAEVAALAGAKRIIIANQIVGNVNMKMVLNLMVSKRIDIYSCVDNLDNVKAWQKTASAAGVVVPLFIELGVSGGRCGCRTDEQVQALAKAIVDSSHLKLAGIELYEGVIGGDTAEIDIRKFLTRATILLTALKHEYGLDEAIISGAGSAWYDVVAEEFSQLNGLTGIIRPGCYAIHDTGIYEDAQALVNGRAITNSGFACDLNGDLTSSLEVWAYVISTPEQGKAVVGLGKRDVAFDAGLPIVERVIRDGIDIEVSALCAIKVMDQHMFVEMPNDDLKVGDLLVMSTSHPCLTFDKWRYVGVVDESDSIINWMPTYF